MRMRYPHLKINPLDPRSNEGQQTTYGNPVDKTQLSFNLNTGPDGSKYDVKGGKIGKHEKLTQHSQLGSLKPFDQESQAFNRQTGLSQTRYTSLGGDSEFDRATEHGQTIIIDNDAPSFGTTIQRNPDEILVQVDDFAADPLQHE